MSNRKDDPEAAPQRWLFRGGGLAALAIAVGYLAIIALYAKVGPAPTGGEAKLAYFDGKSTTWWTIVGISVFTNFLYFPVAFSLYFALRNLHRFAVLIGVTFVGLFAILENAVNWTLYGALIVLSGGYAAAVGEGQKAIYVAAATYASAVLDSPLAAVWAIGTLSIAILVIGLVMLKGVFSRPSAYVGILTGVLGLVAVAGLDEAVILNAVAALIWLVLVGLRLVRLGEE